MRLSVCINLLLILMMNKVDKVMLHQDKFCANPSCRHHVTVTMGTTELKYLHADPKVNPFYGVLDTRKVNRVSFVSADRTQGVFFCEHCANVVGILQDRGMIR